MSILSAIGKGFKSVFTFLASSKGQAIISTGEAAAVAFGLPQATVNLANNWMTEIIKTEAIATAAAQQDGTGTQKAAAVTAAMTPQVLAFAQQQGLPTPDAATIQKASDSLVAFLNAFSGASTTNAAAKS